MPFTASQIAEKLRGEVIGDGSVQLTGFAPADRARAGDLTFADKEAYFAAAEASQASGHSCVRPVHLVKKVLIRVPNARIAVARVLPLFFPPDEAPAPASIPARASRPRRKLIPRRISGRVA